MKTHLAQSFVVASGVAVLVWSAAAATQTRIPPSTMQYPLVWEFESPPPRATPTPGSACEAADRYVKLIAAKRAKEVPELFAEDGVFLFQGQVRRGRKEIHGFYDDVNLRGAIPISLIDSGAECIMELANLTTAGDDIWRLSAIDHFTVAPDGQIARLVIYVQRSLASAAGSGTPSATQR